MKTLQYEVTASLLCQWHVRNALLVVTVVSRGHARVADQSETGNWRFRFSQYLITPNRAGARASANTGRSDTIYGLLTCFARSRALVLECEYI